MNGWDYNNAQEMTMSRVARRVPLDFDWPMNKTWEGYLMPAKLHEETCETCDGHGDTTARQWAQASAAMLMMLAEDVREQERGRPMHPYFDNYSTYGYGSRPSKDILELTSGLAGRGPRFMGHDSIDNWNALKAIIIAAGLDPETWGICQDCKGNGSTEKYPGQRKDANEWKRSDPPKGAGWQMWENVSEGSPVSPVFETPEELADWLSESGATLFARHKATKERWLRIILGEDMGEVEIAPGVVAI